MSVARKRKSAAVSSKEMRRHCKERSGGGIAARCREWHRHGTEWNRLNGLGMARIIPALAFHIKAIKGNGIAVNCGAKDMDRMATRNINYKNQEGMTNG